jgi:hypothetical protein
MRNQKLNFWLMSLVGLPAFVWLIAELIRVFFEVVNRSGFLSVPFDGVIQHKVGELMVGVPLFLILLLDNKWSKERTLALADQMQGWMIVGGLLNGLAWYSLREREAWNSFFRVWCLILLFVGLFASQIAKWLVRWARERTLRAS